ncbi:MAG: orotate phosphoribosyltransferase [Candidatus Cloacimonadota bacterium]|nr:MAG: orotate phosphoribosyltransferase [Candidatus Cloacimonadota bacterium]
MKSIEIILQECQALLRGHFKLTSGRHSDRYIEKIKIINQPDKTAILCKELAEKLKNIEADVIVGPAMGGIVLAFEVAKNLNKKFVFTQRKDGKMTIRSGFALQPGQKAIIIEDIVTTGGSVFEVIECLKEHQVEVSAIGVIVDRSGGKVDFGAKTEALLTADIQSWEADECPLCKENVPFNTPGSSDKK